MEVKDVLSDLLFKLKVLQLEKEKCEENLYNAGLKITFKNFPGNQTTEILILHIIERIMGLGWDIAIEFMTNPEFTVDEVIEMWEVKGNAG